ncbi:acetyltransferase (GNAT) family protein [Natranaerovirga pectinivora]|uniref:Acetyltransferase (GNAT) family protein n=1 Tax=Natranaerovirga pectinivora TaxID=682400 RepID=A0A4R3MP83_9FIRM|nr:GNAT family N-acetyltransferase [Natranaerovirga pectinivora]TCT16071.1 acetyltransferase (GNAT) family protein [Natranaerovirga pectinivora]
MYLNKTNAVYEVLEGDTNNLEDIYIRYSKAFPENERKSLEQLKKLMITGDYKLLLLKEAQKGEINGYAFVYIINDQKTLWLDYIVIQEGYKGKGVGSEFFNKILKYFGKEYIGMFMEVEMPDGNDINQERRLNYYKKLGASIVSMEYKLPTNDGGFEMYLMYQSINNMILTKNHIMGSIKKVYEVIHSDINDTEALYQQVINTIG